MKTDIMMMLMSDTYKHTHPRMYPRKEPYKMKKLVSYLTPRKNMSEAFPHMVFVGIQPFIMDYLIDGFNKQNAYIFVYNLLLIFILNYVIIIRQMEA